MPPKECPHCGNRVSADTKRCPCGFTFQTDGVEVRGANAAREVSGRSSADRGKKAKPGRKADRSKRSSSTPKRPKKAPAKEEPSDSPETVIELELPGPKANLLIQCPACPAQISKRARRCPKCGESPFAPCEVCGERILSGSAECPECGDPDPFGS